MVKWKEAEKEGCRERERKTEKQVEKGDIDSRYSAARTSVPSKFLCFLRVSNTRENTAHLSQNLHY